MSLEQLLQHPLLQDAREIIATNTDPVPLLQDLINQEQQNAFQITLVRPYPLARVVSH